MDGTESIAPRCLQCARSPPMQSCTTARITAHGPLYPLHTHNHTHTHALTPGCPVAAAAGGRYVRAGARRATAPLLPHDRARPPQPCPPPTSSPSSWPPRPCPPAHTQRGRPRPAHQRTPTHLGLAPVDEGGQTLSARPRLRTACGQPEHGPQETVISRAGAEPGR